MANTHSPVLHTPLPWHRDQYGNIVTTADGRDRVRVSGFALSMSGADHEAKANDDFIFKVCHEYAELKRKEASHQALIDALDTLIAVVGLTAFKYPEQAKVLQEAVDQGNAALAQAREKS